MNLASPVTADGRLGTRVACLLAGGALLLALAVLAGWLFNVVALTSILPGLVSMKPMSALALALCALSLGLFALGFERLGLVAAGLDLVLGMATLSEIAFGLDFGPAVRQPQIVRGVTAIGHEFQPLGINDELAADEGLLQQHLMRRLLVVEAEAVAVEADGPDAGRNPRIIVSALERRRLPSSVVSRMGRVLREGVQDVG